MDKLVEEHKKQEEATWALANKGDTDELKVDILKVHGLIREINPNPRSRSTSQVTTNTSTDMQPPSKRAKKGPHQKWSIEVLPELKEEVEARKKRDAANARKKKASCLHRPPSPTSRFS